jgi:enoyl-CoA hydratase/carnithine racemase
MTAPAQSATPETRAQLNPHCQVAIDTRGVATLTICDAGPLIIFGTAVIDAVRNGLATLAKNDSIRVLIIRGDSERAFVGGADIKELIGLEQKTAEAFITRLRDACEAVRQFPAPVIARIPGWVLGGGLEFAACCDFRVASDNSHYGMPEVRVGIPSVIHAALLPRLIGSSRTRWLVMTAENIDAATALDWGLVDVVTPAANLDAEVDKLVGTLLLCGHEALVAQKRLMHQWEELPLKESIDATIKVFGQSFLTDEPQRYMREFVNRPRPAKK